MSSGSRATVTTTKFRVFIPTTLFTSRAVDLFEEAGMELVYALPEEERLPGLDTDIPALTRRVSDLIDDALPDMNALNAITVKSQLQVTRDMISRAPSMLVVFVPSVGTDAIDIDACTDHGVAVVNAAGNNYVSVSEHAVGFMLALARKIARDDRVAHRDGGHPNVPDWNQWPAVLRGKTVGVVGFGFIGREVARICQQAFGMRVLVYDPFIHPVEAERLGVVLVKDLDELLPEADYVSVHTPLTPETHHLIGWDQLVAMKSTAFLLNTSRGPTVDTDALVRALQANEIAGAALDVTEPEPLPRGHPLFAMENVIHTPHMAGAAPGIFPNAIVMATEATIEALRGERPLNLVNPSVWSTYCERLEEIRKRL